MEVCALFITTVHSFEALDSLKQAGADGVIVGIEDLSIRSSKTITLSELHVWKEACDHCGLELYVNALKLMMEEDLAKASELLRLCRDLNVAGIYIADEGWIYLAQQISYQDHLIYQPETLITNHQDVQFYLDQGCKAVSLAHELSLEEIERISKVPGIEVLIHGHYSILYSRRPLVTNYCKAIGKKELHLKNLSIIESTRSDRMPIVEDTTGTHIFSAQPIQSLNQLEQMKQMGIQRFRIDSIFYDDNWTLGVLHAYQNNGKLDGSDAWYSQKSILKKEDPL